MPNAIPEFMPAVEITEAGGPDVLKLTEVPVPTLGESDVLIQVGCAGVNRPDVLQRAGSYPSPPGHSKLPGLEVAGRVVAVGTGVTHYAVGDLVTALTNGGGYAGYASVDAGTVLPVPAGLTVRDAAALPETVLTVWHNVFERGAAAPGDTLLVHGGSSGIGTTAIQIGVARGVQVVVTAGSHEKCAACLKLGAARAINYHDEDFVPIVKEMTGKGANVILDMVGGDYIARNIKAAATDGRIVQIAFLQGSKREIDLMAVMLKRLTLTGSTLRARDAAFKARLTDAVRAEVWPLVERGAVRPLIHTVFPLAEAAKAHALMESNAHIGKIMLDVDPELADLTAA